MSRWGPDGGHGGGQALVPMPDPTPHVSSGTEAFVTYGRGILKVFNVAKDFGFISPIFRSEDSEGPPLNLGAAEGLWFFGNHSLPPRAVPGTELTFEIWETAPGKSQARDVQVAAELTVAARPDERMQEFQREAAPRRHANEPKVIYPSVYVSDVPVEYTEATIRDLHRQLGLNPDTIMGLKYLPFTEVSLGLSTDSQTKEKVAPVTGAVIIRYMNDEAANGAVERLKGHPIRTSKGVTKHLGAKHAAPAKWVVQRRQEEEQERRHTSSRGESLMQKVKGVVARVAMSGYGVIKSADWGEVMWRQYELPTNIRTLQFADPTKFKKEVESRKEFLRLKDMEGKDVEAELYKLPDGGIRAWHVRILQPNVPPMMADGSTDGLSSPPFAHPAAGAPGIPSAPGAPPPPPERPAAMGSAGDGNNFGGPPSQREEPPTMMPPGMGPPPPGFMGGPGGPPPPGMGPPPGMFPGMPPPYGDPNYQAQVMQMMQAQLKKEKKEKKKEKKDKKEKKRRRSTSGSRGRSRTPPPHSRRHIDDDDF